MPASSSELAVFLHQMKNFIGILLLELILESVVFEVFGLVVEACVDVGILGLWRELSLGRVLPRFFCLKISAIFVRPQIHRVIQVRLSGALTDQVRIVTRVSNVFNVYICGHVSRHATAATLNNSFEFRLIRFHQSARVLNFTQFSVGIDLSSCVFVLSR